MASICSLQAGVRWIPLNREGSRGKDADKELLLNINSCHLCARHRFKCQSLKEACSPLIYR